VRDLEDQVPPKSNQVSTLPVPEEAFPLASKKGLDNENLTPEFADAPTRGSEFVGSSNRITNGKDTILYVSESFLKSLLFLLISNGPFSVNVNKSGCDVDYKE